MINVPMLECCRRALGRYHSATAVSLWICTDMGNPLLFQ